ncbi:MAG: Ldh family oxidoreductase [Gammaproteobacteria bacterium]|nr:MAG: Ldh family oxidoreductase [Gammaproteobacteria bacterium]
MTDYQRIDYEKLCELVSSRLQQAGVPAERAKIEARIMAEADLLEVPSHGVRMLPGLIAALTEARVAPAPELKIVRDLGAICVLDFNNGPGRFASSNAMQSAIDRAKQFGVGVCLAKNTTHWGRAHAYASRAAQAGFIGICSTNAIPTMAIWGAKKRVIGNNPLAIGIPGVEVDKPVVLDMAMSQAAVGKVGTWLREGKNVPANWGIDADGNPANNAQDILAGAVLPMGEHKGAGLALMIELLTAALAGAAFTQEIFASDPSGIDAGSTKIFIALNVDAFIERELFQNRVADFLQYLEQDASPFQYPGERGWEARDKNLKEGVPLHNEIVAQLIKLGIQL